MTSPTKVNTGNTRPVTTDNVLNAQDRGVEREQLNRILSSLSSRLTTVEDNQSGGSGDGSVSALIAIDGSIDLQLVDTTYYIGVSDNGLSTAKYQDNSVTTAKIAVVNGNVGTFGAADTVGSFTVNAKGQVTGASDIPIEITTSQVTGLDAIIADAEYAQSTGLKFGGVLSIDADPTKFDVSAGAGEIVDYWTDITQPPVVTDVTWNAFNAQTVTNLGTQTITYILIDSSGNIVQQNTFPTPDERRENIFLGSLGHTNLTTINAVQNIPDIIHSPMGQVRDYIGAVGIVNLGHTVSANGANLSINITEGYLVSDGVNFRTDPQDPSRVYSAAQTPATIRRRTQTGNGATGVTTIDPGNYDVGGTITALSGTKYTNQRVYQQLSGNIIVQYGQTEYNSMASAVAGIGTEAFVEFPNVQDTAVLIGIISVRSTATDLSNSSQAVFTRTSKFGETTNAGSGLQTLTLQQAYNNSTTPEILTDSTRGALSVRRGSAADTDIVFEVQNGAGSNTATITGAGAGSLASLTLTTDLAITEGGTGASSASGARTNLGATTVGSNLFTATNPSALTFIRVNADNSVTFRSASDFRNDLGLGTIATQNANNVAITGGTIDGTSIGATTPSTGAFTTLTTTGNATLGGSLIAAVSGNDFIARQNTSNGADSKSMFLCGGGGASVARGGLVVVYGNEYSGAGGYIDLNAGDAPGARVRLQVNGSNIAVAESTGLTVTAALSCTGNAILGDGADDAHTANGTLNVTGNLSAANFAGTTYTPTVTGVTNVTGTTAYVCQYARVGNTVTVSGRISVDPTAASATTEVRISLPIASNFSAEENLGGSGVYEFNFEPVRIYADATNDQAFFQWFPLNSSNQSLSFTFTYRII